MRRKMTTGFIGLCALLLTSCAEVLFVGAHVLAPIVGPPYIAIESSIKNAREREERWNSYPEPYRELLTSYNRYEDPQKNYPDRYRALIALLKQHSLLVEDQNLSLNVLNDLAFISWKAINEVYKANKPELWPPGPSPYVEYALDEAEYFFRLDETGKLNGLIADGILFSAFNGSYLRSLELSHIMDKATDGQRKRLASLLMYSAETVRFDDIKRLEHEVQSRKASRLALALLASPTPEQRAQITRRLHDVLYACFAERIWCGNDLARHAYRWLSDRAENDEAKLNLYVLAIDHHWGNAIFSPVSWSKVLEVAAQFSKPEHKLTVLTKGWKLLDLDKPANPEVRGSLYYHWRTYKDERALEAIPEFMLKASRFGHYGYNTTDPLFYRSEISMMEGRVEEALTLRARSIIGNWYSFYSGSRKTYLEWNGQKIPYVNEKGVAVDFTWKKPVSFYAFDVQSGTWTEWTTTKPDDLLMQLFLGANKCLFRKVVYKEPASLFEAQCVNAVVRRILAGDRGQRTEARIGWGERSDAQHSGGSNGRMSAHRLG
ncbi:MAG: hypothetical protein LBL72_00755 [Candidatus Accumulibacter sp.]|nr:hypothetical protein [Accumulibacter sp.]